MKIRNIENLINVTLDMSFDDALKVQTYAPEAMILKDEAENQTFKVFVKNSTFLTPMGELCDFAAEFVGVREKPTIWVGIADVPKDEVEDFLLEHHGMKLAKVKKIEQQMLDALKDVEAEVNSIKDSVSVL